MLQKQVEDPEAKILVTTIRKLDRFIAANKNHPICSKRVAIIFDGCRRSQFGEMYSSITMVFKRYHLFGFTGMPVFAANAGQKAAASTTEQTFGNQLHSCTAADAIGAGNVLPWRIDYVSTMASAGGEDKQAAALDALSALGAPECIEGIVADTLDHYARKTGAKHSYTKDGKRLHGFNSIFAVQSVPMAMRCYNGFQRQIRERKDELRRLKAATIFSFNPGEAVENGILPDGSFTAEGLDESSREFPDRAIADYNTMCGTCFSSCGDSFECCCRDLSLRMKNRELGLLIVVNTFLTGFDAPTMNTLWVNKNLKQHGLIRAFSRTNRILNSVKKYGSIISCRNLQAETEEALPLFWKQECCGYCPAEEL